jgi:flagellar basal-body rod protein FlgF
MAPVVNSTQENTAVNANYLSLAAQMTIVKNFETIADNIANSSTTGFRASSTSFGTVVEELSGRSVRFTTTGQDSFVRTTGASTSTGNPWDVMVAGDAWLAIRTPGGIAYTKDGRLKLSEGGEIQTLAGHAILGPDFTPVASGQSGIPTIGRDGAVYQSGQRTGTIGMFALPPDAPMQRAPSNGLYSQSAGIPLSDNNAGSLIQGFLENSNVDAVKELSKMLTTNRSFETITAAIESMETSRSEAIKTLAPV